MQEHIPIQGTVGTKKSTKVRKRREGEEREGKREKSNVPRALSVCIKDGGICGGKYGWYKDHGRDALKVELSNLGASCRTSSILR